MHKRFLWIIVIIVMLLSILLESIAQERTIITVGGGGLPADGSAAVGVSISTGAVAADNTGGFYVACKLQNRVYRVTADGTLKVFAGNGLNGSDGDGGAAINASVEGPVSVALDATGNVYIGTYYRIRRVDAAGIISTVAGTGSETDGGDGGLAIAAWVYGVTGMVFDSAGNLYFADSSHHRIRRINAQGIISTVAGTGEAGFSGDDGPAVSAMLKQPMGIALDSQGNIVIADTYNHRIRRVHANGVITTIAGTGAAAYSGDNGAAIAADLRYPYSIAADNKGNLLIADRENCRIRRIDTNGIITTVTGTGSPSYPGDGGPAASASIIPPMNVAADADGNIFFTGSINVWRINASGIIHTVAGNGSMSYGGDGGAANSAMLNTPSGVALDSAGNIYFSDSYNNRVRSIDVKGVMTTVAGTGSSGYNGDGIAATSAKLNAPAGVALDSTGNLYIADTYNHRIRRVDIQGMITTVAGTGSGSFFGDGGLAVNARLNQPKGVAVDSQGTLFIADTNNNRIRRVTTAGIISTVAGSSSMGAVLDDVPATSSSLWKPAGIAVDVTGNLYIADTENNRIRRVNPSGIINTIAGDKWGVGSAGCSYPSMEILVCKPAGVAVDNSGNVYAADTNNHRIKRISPDGAVSTIAGMRIYGSNTYGGDGGSALSAKLYNPSALALDGAGALYIADTENYRIRKAFFPVLNDFNADGNPDIIWRNSANGQNSIWLMNRKHLLEDASFGDDAPVDWRIAGTGDFNSDGKTDILWRNTATGENYVWLMDGTARAGGGYLNPVADLTWTIAGVADFNSDGKPDLLWRNASTGGNFIWYMDGMERSGGDALAAVPDLNWTIAGIGDFNTDGKQDILWRNIATGENFVWYMDGAMRNGGASLDSVADFDWQIIAVGDYSSDGKPDILWRHKRTGENFIWYLDGVVRSDGEYLDAVTDTHWLMFDKGESVTSPKNSSDFSGDGKPDIVWRNHSTGENFIWYMNSAVRNGGAYLDAVAAIEWKIAGMADFNADGQADLLWRNSSTGENYVWYMQGAQRKGGASLESVADTNWKIEGVADFNQDGHADIMWRNSATGENYVWYMHGVTRSGGAYLPPVDEFTWKIAGLGDFNNDGKPDIVWRNTSSGENYVWYMNGVIHAGGNDLEKVDAQDWQIVGIEDMNRDGKPDLLWRNSATGENYVWYMNGITRTGEGYLDIVEDLNWQIAGAGE